MMDSKIRKESNLPRMQSFNVGDIRDVEALVRVSTPKLIVLVLHFLAFISFYKLLLHIMHTF